MRRGRPRHGITSVYDSRQLEPDSKAALVAAALAA
jgi:hypothetical protein